MARKLHSARYTGSGVEVEVEVENAYTDGRSRIDRIVIPRSEIGTGTRQEIAAAVRRHLRRHDDLRTMRGLDVEAEPETKAVWERRAEEAWADWWRWKTTKDEADLRAEPAPVRNALSARATAAWEAYRAVLVAWRNAT